LFRWQGCLVGRVDADEARLLQWTGTALRPWAEGLPSAWPGHARDGAVGRGSEGVQAPGPATVPQRHQSHRGREAHQRPRRVARGQRRSSCRARRQAGSGWTIFL